MTQSIEPRKILHTNTYSRNTLLTTINNSNYMCHIQNHYCFFLLVLCSLPDHNIIESPFIFKYYYTIRTLCLSHS